MTKQRQILGVNTSRNLDKSLIAEFQYRPNHSSLSLIRSDALLELGDFAGSAKAAESMMSLKPNLASYSRASHLRWLQGDLAGAKEVARLAVDASAPGESSAWAIAEAATLFWHDADVDGAEAGYDLALTRMGNFPPALVGKGRVEWSRGKPALAAQHFAKAMELYPTAETAWLLGDALDEAGDKAAADAAYAEVLKHGKAGDRRTLAYFYAVKNQEPAEAVRLIERELKDRGDTYTHDVASWVYLRAGRLEDARRESDLASKLGTRDARLFFHAGAIRVAQGEGAEGVILIQQALKQNPHFDRTQAREAKALLEAQGIKAAR